MSNPRIIADPGPDKTELLNTAVSYDGTSSYSLDGLDIDYYEWSLVYAPLESEYVTYGSNGSTTTINTLHETGAFSEENSPLLQPGDTLILIISGSPCAYTINDSGWDWDSDAHKYVRGVGWDNDSIITTDAMPNGLTAQYWAIHHSMMFFSGVTDPVDALHFARYTSKPYAIPDVTGLYEVQLKVGISGEFSEPSTALLNISAGSFALGVVPDVSYIWDHLSNFWSLLEDKEKVTTVWSGFAQAAANVLLTAWQIDYNKSLKDIQRTFKRKWLSYSPVIEDSSTDIRIVRGNIYPESPVIWPVTFTSSTILLKFEDDDIVTVTLPAATLSVQQTAALINNQLQTLSYPSIACVSEYAPGTNHLYFSYPGLLQIISGTALAALNFVATDNSLSGTTGYFDTVDDKRYTFYAKIYSAVSAYMDFLTLGVSSEDILGMSYSDENLSWDISSAATTYLVTTEEDTAEWSATDWVIPSVVTTSVDLDGGLVSVGDLALFSVTPDSGQEALEINCSIVAIHGDKIGFDPVPLLLQWNGHAENYTTTFIGVKRTKYIPVDDLVVSIPRLQEIIINSDNILEENKDYRITKVNGSTKAIEFREGLFLPLDPPADTYWAELTELDNRPNIENNFGSLVPPFSETTYQEVEESIPSLDYLSAVQGLWYAYWGGPSVYRIQVGLQILLGLPYAIEAGTVTEINPSFSAKQGRILIQDKDSSIIRAYYYTLEAGLMIWPDATLNAGRELQVGDEVDKFTPLTGGVDVVDWVNSIDKVAGLLKLDDAPSRLQQYFKFLVICNVDTFNPANIAFAVDFVKNIKPHYTIAQIIAQKTITTPIDKSDEIHQIITIHARQAPGSTIGYCWDDYDGGGNLRSWFDEETVLLQFIFDHAGLYPGQDVTVDIPT